MTSVMEFDDNLEFPSPWTMLKKDLDSDMPPEDLQMALQLLGDKIPREFECKLPSDLLTYLENNDPRGLSTIKHVLGEMEYFHHGKRTWSYEKKIEDCQKYQMNEYFVGREAELTEILKSCSPSRPSKIAGYWIYGKGGLGKTSLVREVCSRVMLKSRFKVIFVQLSASSSFTDFLISFLHGMNHFTPETLEEQLKAGVLQGINTLQEDTLIVFDSIENVYRESKGKVESFITQMFLYIGKRSRVNVKALFTSKIAIEHSPKDLKMMEIKPLSMEEAEKLLMMFIKPAKLGTKEIEKILQFYSRSPLNLRLVSAELRRRDSYGMPVNTSNVQSLGSNVFIKNSIDELEQDARLLMAMLMIFETSAFSKSDVDVLTDNKQANLLKIIDLTNKCLLEETLAPNHQEELKNNQDIFWYRIHGDVLAELKKELRGEEIEQNQNIAKTRFCRATLAQFEQKLHNFDTHYESAINYITKSKARIEILFSCLAGGLPHVEMSEGHLRALNHAHTICMSFRKRDEVLKRVANYYKGRDSVLHCVWAIQRAMMYLEFKETSEAESILEQIENEINHEPEYLGRQEAILMADFYITKGRILRGKNKYRKALDEEKKSLDILQRYVKNDTSREAAVYNGIGNILFNMEEYEESHLNHQKAVDLMETFVVEEASLDLSIYTFNLGTIFYAKAVKMKSFSKDEAKGQCVEAIKYYNKSIEIDVKLKQDQLYNHGEKLKIRARAYRMLNEYEKAIADAKRNVEIKEKVLHGGRREAVILGYYQVGELYRKWRQDMFKDRGAVTDNDRAKQHLIDSWSWLNKAAKEIYNKRQSGLDPQHEESPSFANIYVEVAKAMSDTLGMKAERFSTEFLNGDYFRSESDESAESISNDGIRSDDSIEEGEVIYARQDSGVVDMDMESTTGQKTASTCDELVSDSDSSRQQSDNLRGEMLMEIGEEDQRNSSGHHKRKLSCD